MLSGLLDRLRPKNDTAAAIAAALAETEAARGAQAQRIGALEAGRGAALLEGGETARRQEAALREARDEAERLAALAEALRAKHAEAEMRERRAALELLAADAGAKAEAAGRAIARDYPRLAGELVKLLRAEREALAAKIEADERLAAAGSEAAGIALPPTPQAFYAPTLGVASPVLHLCQRITLPALDGSPRHNGVPDLWCGPAHAVIRSAAP
jgi:hypothetical protein